MKKFAIRISYYLLFAAIVANSLLYLLVDFRTYDVISSVRSYGAIQLLLTLILIILSVYRRETAARAAAFGIILWALIVIQVVPAICWILFDGRTVAEYPWDSGIIGSWVYGAYHIGVIIWGIVNYYVYKGQTRVNCTPKVRQYGILK
jgi:hypothetical protein